MGPTRLSLRPFWVAIATAVSLAIACGANDSGRFAIGLLRSKALLLVLSPPLPKAPRVIAAEGAVRRSITRAFLVGDRCFSFLL